MDKKAVACGLGVMEQGYVGLLDIVVKEEYRGCGFGKVLCQSLLEKAKEKRCRNRIFAGGGQQCGGEEVVPRSGV